MWQHHQVIATALKGPVRTLPQAVHAIALAVARSQGDLLACG